MNDRSIENSILERVPRAKKVPELLNSDDIATIEADALCFVLSKTLKDRQNISNETASELRVWENTYWHNMAKLALRKINSRHKN